MKLSQLLIRHFKRFTDLRIDNLGPDVRLVVMAGPNGSGKSSLFDAMHLWRAAQHGGWDDDHAYYRKGTAVTTGTFERVAITFHGAQPVDEALRRSFYIRTAYRHDPEFHMQALQRQSDILARRFGRMIDSDAAVSANYGRLTSNAFEDAFAKEPELMTLGQFREKVIGEIRDATLRLFPDLKLNTLGNPLENGTFRFDKGSIRGFDYKNLSGGEKAAFDLILDIIVKRSAFSEAIYCIDEPDAHMNARLQAALLAEIYALVPAQGQLWVATHSVGMMRKARELYAANPHAVAFLNFADRDFDQPVVMEPSRPTRSFWQQQLQIALDDLVDLVAPRIIVICEGNPAGAVPGNNAEHDARCYDVIFADEFPDSAFLAGGNSADVITDRLALAAAFSRAIPGIDVRRVIDRDDHAAADVTNYNTGGIRVLSRRNLEAYIYDDEVLTALCQATGRPGDAPHFTRRKATRSSCQCGQRASGE